MDFFNLTTQITEDKVIDRQERIVADSLSLTGAAQYTIETTSLADRVKIKFLINAISYTDDQNITRVYAYGEYAEMENGDFITFVNSTINNPANQSFRLTYNCGLNNGNGVFITTLTVDDRYVFYISDIVVQDSYVNFTNSWLNPDNPNNIISELRPEPINAVGGGLPSGGNVGDMLVNIAPGTALWYTPTQVIGVLPKATNTVIGVGRADGVTIDANDGVYTVKTATTTVTR